MFTTYMFRTYMPIRHIYLYIQIIYVVTEASNFLSNRIKFHKEYTIRNNLKDIYRCAVKMFTQSRYYIDNCRFDLSVLAIDRKSSLIFDQWEKESLINRKVLYVNSLRNLIAVDL